MSLSVDLSDASSWSGSRSMFWEQRPRRDVVSLQCIICLITIRVGFCYLVMLMSAKFLPCSYYLPFVINTYVGGRYFETM